ncbi:MAG: hypothetical protein EBX50_05580 [Chitinophagia bacterium]|nr:hypothetical protein [Chitinophagia bacterium]
MRNFFLSFWLLISSSNIFSQGVDESLIKMRQRIDSVNSFQVNLQLETDISFVNMPVKRAVMQWEKGKPVQFTSKDFILLPKKGLDFSLSSLFEYPFVTLVRGITTQQGQTIKEMNVIPADRRADFSIATLWINTSLRRVESAEISTNKDGIYFLQMHYRLPTDFFPDRVEVKFEIEKIKIPLNFMGKGTRVDKEKMKADGMKSGKIFLNMSDYIIRKIGG